MGVIPVDFRVGTPVRLVHDRAGEQPMTMMTTRGYVLSEVVSALQKAIRRGDGRVAGYFAIEMFESNYAAYAWRRLLTVSAEDCAGIVTQEIKALYDSWVVIDKNTKGRGRVFLAKAVVILCQAKKSRDADHLNNLVYDPRLVDEQQLERALVEARASREPIPDYALDCHTGQGARMGKTRAEFFLTEHDALHPRAPGLFDTDLEALRALPPHAREQRVPRRRRTRTR
jgi:replication-associated recombination protein RarA